MLRPWSSLPIIDCGEALEKVPSSFHCIQPHPYQSRGAPYGANCDPWRLRVGVNKRLVGAQAALKKRDQNLSLAIFDAWRPISVQAFMVELTIKEECFARGINRFDSLQSRCVKEIVEEVERFWAPPSLDPRTPPPHSTGAAVDLTIVDLEGNQLDMGGSIDDIGEISEPDYYSSLSNSDPSPKYCLWDQHRCLLADVMIGEGFVQHPNEWWHFSFGDQLWAWRKHRTEAIYGGWTPSASNL